jgi:catechol 2,3-dioxygenase-like lactoylglutathione lyase family enzyme
VLARHGEAGLCPRAAEPATREPRTRDHPSVAPWRESRRSFFGTIGGTIVARVATVERGEPDVKKIQVQGLHHITIVGSTKQSAVDFWQGALGMPFVMEQPNLGKPDENHLYFDPGDGRLLTVFTNESREDARRPAPREIGCVEHIAFNVSRATFLQAPARLRDRGIDFIQRDRGFMDSIYLHDPNGLKIELACYKFETPEGCRDVDVLMKAHQLRVDRGDHHITEEHLADAIELLLAERPRLAADQKVPV